MLDYRIAKNYVDAVFAELSEIRRVTGERLDIRVSLFFWDKVQSQNLDVSTLVPASILPKRICPPHVKNTQRAR